MHTVKRGQSAGEVTPTTSLQKGETPPLTNKCPGYDTKLGQIELNYVLILN